MKRTLLALVAVIMVGAFLLIRHAPDTVSSVSASAPLIVIDPGHGGKDPGAVRGSIREKSLNLAIALKLGPLLQQKGYRVYYTRATDSLLASTVLGDLTRRAAMANQLHASLFVSIHVNTEPTGTVTGPIVYYTASSPASSHLARTVTQSLANLTPSVHAPRSIRQWVLQQAAMPAINVEIGFLSHSQDAQRLQSITYQQQLANAIARGLMKYLSSSGLQLNYR